MLDNQRSDNWDSTVVANLEHNNCVVFLFALMKTGGGRIRRRVEN
jgi:hypothetical protein